MILPFLLVPLMLVVAVAVLAPAAMDMVRRDVPVPMWWGAALVVALPVLIPVAVGGALTSGVIRAHSIYKSSSR